ncbi:MAG: 16S rRNA (cytosine(1402)-N(4))-methyltransferase [Patescibacteria group bacterium]
MKHIPVLVDELLDCLKLQPGASVIDATLGLGGHAQVVLERVGPTGRLLGLERSAEGLAEARKVLTPFKAQIVPVHANFRELVSVATEHKFDQVDAVYFDLGLASWQIDQDYQGLSHQFDAPLDMRIEAPAKYQQSTAPTVRWTQDDRLLRIVERWRGYSAAEVLAQASQTDLETVFRELGGVRTWRTVVAAIIEARIVRPIERTGQLVEIVGESPRLLALVFQALRILVNDEYGALLAGLDGAWQVLRPGGRLAVISFHGGEHRLVKQLFRTLSGTATIARVFPSNAEITHNPRSRSATLRYITKTTATSVTNKER